MNSDRRRRARVRLHYALRLSRPDQWLFVETETDNLSSIGFYCTSDQPFWPGENLNCEVVIPSKELGYVDLVLHRRVTVVRVEIRGLEPGFGLACQFDERLPVN